MSQKSNEKQFALKKEEKDKEEKVEIADANSAEKENNISQKKKTMTTEERQAKKKKIIRTSIIAFVIIGLTVGTSFLGPADMKIGEYRVELTFTHITQPETIQFNITVASSANSEKLEYYLPLGESSQACLVIIDKAYKAATHSEVVFQVGILDASNESIQNLELNKVTGKIYGANMERKIRPIANTTIYSSEVEKTIEVFYFKMAVPYKAGIALALLVLVAGLWITEIVPTIVGAFLVPIIVVVTKISTTTEALTPFFDPVIALFLGGFILAEALKKHNIDRRLALGIVSKVRIRPSMLILLLMGISAFLSMWMSNTASAAVMIPIAIALVSQIEKNEGEQKTIGFKKAIVLGIGYAATTGGIASVIGTPANPIAIAGLNEVGIEISFLKWFAFGLPFVMIMLFIIWGYLLLVFKPKVSKESLGAVQLEFKEDLKKLGKMGMKQWITVIIFILTILLWLLAKPIKTWTGGAIALSSGIIALFAVVLIFGTGTLEPKDIKNVNWNALFLFGGGLSLGQALTATGIGDWIASNMGIIEGKHYIVIALIVGGISLIVTAVASNTASAAMLVPLVIPIAFSIGIDPTLLALIVAIGSSVDYALVFGTPPTMISYSTGYFSVKEIFRVGSILDLIGILLLSTVSVLLWVAFGLITV